MTPAARALFCVCGAAAGSFCQRILGGTEGPEIDECGGPAGQLVEMCTITERDYVGAMANHPHCNLAQKLGVHAVIIPRGGNRAP